jgi:hypothetical protein
MRETLDAEHAVVSGVTWLLRGWRSAAVGFGMADGDAVQWIRCSCERYRNGRHGQQHLAPDRDQRGSEAHGADRSVASQSVPVTPSPHGKPSICHGRTDTFA